MLHRRRFSSPAQKPPTHRRFRLGARRLKPQWPSPCRPGGTPAPGPRGPVPTRVLPEFFQGFPRKRVPDPRFASAFSAFYPAPGLQAGPRPGTKRRVKLRSAQSRCSHLHRALCQSGFAWQCSEESCRACAGADPPGSKCRLYRQQPPSPYTFPLSTALKRKRYVADAFFEWRPGQPRDQLRVE